MYTHPPEVRRVKNGYLNICVIYTSCVKKKYLEVPNHHLNCRDEKKGLECAIPLAFATATAATAFENGFGRNPGS